MKIKLGLFLHLLIVSFILHTPAFAADNPWEQKLPFKNATIEYEVTGSANGSETFYTTQYGQLQATYRKTTQKVMFVTMNTDEIEIITPDWVYNIDMTEKTGTKTANPVKFMMEEYNNLSSKEKKMVRKNAEEMGTFVSGGAQVQFQQNAEKILGYNCDLTTMSGSTVYLIHGTAVPLKSETNMMGMNFSSTATSIKTGSVSMDVFTPPKGIEIIHDPQADEAVRSMAKSTLDMMKSPDGASQMQMQPPSETYSTTTPPADQIDRQTPPAQDEGNMQENINNAMDAFKGLFGK